MNEKHLKISPLGGMGNVTRNMFIYEYDDELLIIDCGIGFPERDMLGVDILIPDPSYVLQRLKEGAKIVGLCFTHGHDDHIAALPYILPMLNQEFPIYGSPLTVAFAADGLDDMKIEKTLLTYPTQDQVLKLGKYFSVEWAHVTHSVPDACHLLITTPEGLCYHGSDFNFDMNPVDGRVSEYSKIAEFGRRGILCALVDCLRVERQNWSISETSLYDTLEKVARDCEGKLFVTLMSSNLHRAQMAIDVALQHGRKIVFIGRSIEQNAEVAQTLGVLTIPKGQEVHKRDMHQYKDAELCVIIAGSQGQPGSSLVRAVRGEHPLISVGQNDRVIFSTEPIPGSEKNVYATIDELARNNIEVMYSDILDENLHASGHAGALEQQMLVSLLNPRYVFPIGGEDRHRTHFTRIMKKAGFHANQILLPQSGQQVVLRDGQAEMGDKLFLKDLMVDGLGIGDIGSAVLSDRKHMSQEGMLVVIVPEREGRYDLDHIYVVTRGFVFKQMANEMIQAVKEETADAIRQALDARQSAQSDENELKLLIEKRVTKRVDRMIGRTPLVLPVFLER